MGTVARFRPRAAKPTGGYVDPAVPEGRARPAGSHLSPGPMPPGCKVQDIGTRVDFANPEQFGKRPVSYISSITEGKIKDASDDDFADYVPFSQRTLAEIRDPKKPAKKRKHVKRNQAVSMIFPGETTGERLDRMNAYLTMKGYAS